MDLENGEVKNVEVVRNDFAVRGGGAGVAVSQFLIDKGVNAVVTGNVGSNALAVLSSAGVKVYKGSGLTVREAIEKLVRGELEEITTPTSPKMGRWRRRCPYEAVGRYKWEGGTGKTTVTSIFATLATCVVADCDVDAPNLHILLKPKVKNVIPFKGMKKARIVDEKCERCGLCMDLCRFDAITFEEGKFVVDEIRCEGCGFCYRACPSKAIEMVSEERGKIFVSETDYGDFVYALLDPGEENSGLLVSEVKKIAKEVAEERGVDLIFIDGAPGVGCPVISSLAGTNLALIVTEPTLSGLNDLMRIVELVNLFKIKSFVLINKFDLNEDVTKEIEKFCIENDIELFGKIPFDEKVPEMISQLKIPVNCKAGENVKEVWKVLEDVI